MHDYAAIAKIYYCDQKYEDMRVQFGLNYNLIYYYCSDVDRDVNEVAEQFFLHQITGITDTCFIYPRPTEFSI